MAGNWLRTTSMVGLSSVLSTALAAPTVIRATASDPFAILDKQDWVNPDNMTWDDWKSPPGTNWADPSKKGSIRNFNIAMVCVDYPDQPFTLTLDKESDIFGNPQPSTYGLDRDEVPTWYRDFLNKPQDINLGHTLHEYWMGDSAGQYGVDLTVFGAYRMPSNFWQYGIDDEDFNEGACPEPGPCSVDLRRDALGAWRTDVGNETANQYELVFILSAGQDESSTWQEFGEMKFATPEDVTDEFGPPANSTLPNWAATRYVNWTSWMAAAAIWPNAGGGSSTQGESSGMATFAHELSHLLGIGDNYNNPFGVPARRAYTGPWSMLSRGSFNGPGGPHTRWQIPPTQGASMGSLHTVRDKHQIGLITTANILQIDRAALADTGLVVADITARAVDPGTSGIIGFNISLPKDLSPFCNVSTEPLCDGGGYDAYNVEVVDRMGADSFCPDSGVMISKSKNSDRRQPFQWTIDANPQDIEVVDFILPNGQPRYLTIGDYRQLADALFHAGTRSGSEFEFVDESNRLQFYIVDIHRSDDGELSYTVAVRSLDGDGAGSRGLELGEPVVVGAGNGSSPSTGGVLYSVPLTNTGEYAADEDATTQHGQDLEKYLDSDVFRATVEVDGEGWKVEVPNALATAKNGEETSVKVAVGAEGYGAAKEATVTLTVVSESDPTKEETKSWTVKL